MMRISAPARCGALPQKHVESPLSVSVLSGEFSDGGTILVDVDLVKNQLVFRSIRQDIPAETVTPVDA